jgi:hypothetical protein
MNDAQPNVASRALRHDMPRTGGKETWMSHWIDVPLTDVPQVPGMTNIDELKYFYWCCATKHQPGRRVVELGPYVGRSTMALAAGLRRSADPHGKVVSVDRFLWEPWTIANTLDDTLDGLSESQRARLKPGELQPKEGDSFLPLFQIFTEDLKDSIHVVNAELEAYRWSGEPIDVLMVDAAKSWDALDQIVRQFFPCLVDGATVIHQDYKHFYTYWLHPVTERMLEQGVLTLAENVTGWPTQGFRFHKTPSFRAEDYVRSAFSDAEADRLMARSVRRFRGPQERLAVVGARCRMLKEQGQNDRARAVFIQAMREGGFADNYALADLLMVAQDCAQLLTPTLLIHGVTNPASAIAGRVRLLPTGLHGITIPAVACEGQPFVVEMPPLDVADSAELTMHFSAGYGSQQAPQIRIQAADATSTANFYDEEFSLASSQCQSVVIPLAGRSKIKMRWTTSSEGLPAVADEIICIAPMLLAAA